MKFPVLYQRCPCVVGAFRHKIRNKLDEFEKKSPNIKENLVKNWKEIQKNLSRKIDGNKVIYCKICGEPSRNEICRGCQIMGKLK